MWPRLSILLGLLAGVATGALIIGALLFLTPDPGPGATPTPSPSAPPSASPSATPAPSATASPSARTERRAIRPGRAVGDDPAERERGLEPEPVSLAAAVAVVVGRGRARAAPRRLDDRPGVEVTP